MPIRIYRQPTSHNKPWVVYDGNRRLGSFHSLEEIKEVYPDAHLKSRQDKQAFVNGYEFAAPIVHQLVELGYSRHGVELYFTHFQEGIKASLDD